MASLSELNKRSESINSISKMTKAMQLISGVKMRQAKTLLAQTLPFTLNCVKTMENVLTMSPDLESHYLSFRKKAPGDPWRLVVYVMTGDRGLDGSYNRDVVEHTLSFLKIREAEIKNAGFKPQITLRVMGKKGRDSLRKAGYEVEEDFYYSLDNPAYVEAAELAEKILERYDESLTDEVLLDYTVMTGPLTGIPIYTRVLPADLNGLKRLIELSVSDKEIAELLPDDFFEAPPPSTYFSYPEDVGSLLEYLFSTYLSGVVYGAVVQAYTGEQTASMTSMDSASRNSSELLKDLSRKKNRMRQQAITNELIEITGGAEAMKINDLKRAAAERRKES